VRRSLEILSVKKEANLSGRDIDEEEVGNGDVGRGRGVRPTESVVKMRK